MDNSIKDLRKLNIPFWVLNETPGLGVNMYKLFQAYAKKCGVTLDCDCPKVKCVEKGKPTNVAHVQQVPAARATPAPLVDEFEQKVFLTLSQMAAKLAEMEVKILNLEAALSDQGEEIDELKAELG